jgi:tight adherence protein B
LGDDTAGAVASLRPEFAADADSLALLFTIHTECGGDLAALVESGAASIDHRATERALARTAGAGAILSARMVAALPLLCLPLLPIARAPLFDVPGVAMLVSGVALAVAGLRWIDRLVPVPPDCDDPVAAVAELVANVVAAGVELRRALDRISIGASGEASQPLTRAARRVALGSTWPEALSSSPHRDVRTLGLRLGSAQRLGVPVAGALRLFASDLRAHRRLAFEARTRQAPVLMVLPLVLCVLPSFLLLAFGPFIRGLSLT